MESNLVSYVEEDDFLEDYAGCWWTNGFPENLYPSWLDSFKETISDDKLLKDIYLPDFDVPVTPEFSVLTSKVEMGIDGVEVDIDTVVIPEH